MKYIVKSLLLLVLTIVLAGCGKEEKPRLIMVTNAEFPPYEYMVNQKIDGIDPAIIRHVARELGYELIIQNMAFDSVIAAVQSGKGDVAASGITVTEERKNRVNFTIPYVVAQQLIILPKKSTISNIEDLKKLRIGVQHGTTGDMYVAKNLREPERYANGALAVAALAAGKLDAVVIDQEPAEVFIKQVPGLKIFPEPLTREEYAFAINKKSPELLAQFNKVLLQMQEDGSLKNIIEHYRELNSKKSAADIAHGENFISRLQTSFYINFIKDQRYIYLVKGFGTTIYITVAALFIGLIIGFAVAVIRSTADQTGKFKLLNWLCKFYLTVIRGTPVVVQLLIIYFVIFGTVDVDKVLVAVIAFGINSGAYVAEIIRGGIMSIDRGQMEAGRSLGLSYAQTMEQVILPQAFKNVLPALGNEFIVLLKETSVAGYIALQDLTKAGDIIRSQTYDAFLPLIAVALIYLVVVMLLSSLLTSLEKRLKKNE